MSYQTGTATDIADLFSQLSTFLTGTPGWTDRALTTPGSRGFSKAGSGDTVEVQFRWDTGNPQNVGVYQSDGFSGVGVAPGQHTDDSGNGAISGTNATLATGRLIQLVDSTMLYHFFEDDDYAHVAVRTLVGPPEQWRHFGFGVLEKRGIWTGGAYCYGYDLAAVMSPLAPDATILLDGEAGLGINNYGPFVSTVHVEGLSGQGGSGKWALCWGNASSSEQGNDRQGSPQPRVFIQGGYRAGVTARYFGRPAAQANAGLVPGYPIPLVYLNTVPATDEAEVIGFMPDVVGVNIENYAPGQELTQGSDTWVVFPSFRDNNQAGNETRHQGIAYRKVTT